jgi:type II secretory pathway pseudopilin PulG
MRMGLASAYSTRKRLTGFTLVELLIAAALTALIAATTILSLVNILQINQQAESETLRRQDLNRSLEFISDEVRRATQIDPDATTGVTDAAPDFTLPVGAEAILSLRIPGIEKPVIYYVQNSVSPWLAPRLIYRWGPPLNQNGNYPSSSTPSSWQSQVLVDLLTDSLPDPNNICQTGWSANPAVENRDGFYTCVSPGGRSVELHLRARLASTYGGSPSVYEVSSNASTRSR